jgi:hypothetical protein
MSQMTICPPTSLRRIEIDLVHDCADVLAAASYQLGNDLTVDTPAGETRRGGVIRRRRKPMTRNPDKGAKAIEIITQFDGCTETIDDETITVTIPAGMDQKFRMALAHAVPDPRSKRNRSRATQQFAAVGIEVACLRSWQATSPRSLVPLPTARLRHQIG